MSKPIVGFIIGPTACGKTALSIRVAKALNAEIISADSIQIYKSLDIGSAKPSLAEREGITHHLIDFLSPDASFSVADFQKMATRAIFDIAARGKFPLVVGGSGLYINALTYPLDFSKANVDEELRARLNALDAYKLHSILAKRDPTAAKRLHPNDKKRVVRALEIIESSALSKMPDDFINSKNASIPITPRMLGLTMPRNLLYERINRRVDIMMERGLLNEVRKLLCFGCPASAQSMQGLGYKQLIRHIKGECSLDEAIEAIKTETRHFAKRQITWFKRDERIRWIDVSELNDIIVSEAISAITGEGKN